MRSRFFKRLICLSLILCLLSGCVSQPQEDISDSSSVSGDLESSQADTDAPETSPFALAYNESDSLHPYQAESALNLQLMNLIYDGLVQLDTEFRPVPRIADWVEVDERTVTIKIRSDLVFSDGSPIQNEDVLYSLRQARGDGSAYAERLSNIASMEVDDQGRILLTLTEADRYFASNLDVPIIKADSDSDGLPIGSGRYELIANYVEPYLSVNPRWSLGEAPAISLIYLRETPSQDTLQYNVRTGTVSYAYFDLSGDSSISSVSSATLPVVTNNLVFLGINSSSGLLAQPELRRALSGAINRETVISEGYADRGWPAQTPFNPSFYALLEAEETPAISSRSVAEQLLDTLGYDTTDASGLRINGWGNTISLSILVNEDNEERVQAADAIASQLRLSGIDATVETCSYSDYLTRITEGNFELYLGEISLLANMDLSPLLTGSTAASGVSGQEDLIVRYETMREGRLSLTNFIDAFSRSMPFVPICYRSGTVAYSRFITGDVTATVHDIYLNIEQWGYDDADTLGSSQSSDNDD